MANDFFNEFLVNEWNALDKELSQDHFIAHEQERQETLQQQETQQDRTPDESESVASEQEMRETYDRKESKETKQERLTRIKDEYSRPFVSVGGYGFPQRRRRRMLKLLDILKDTEYPQAMLEQPVMDGTAGSGPGRGLTQLIEQNEPTIMPIARLNGLCKTAIDQDEGGEEDELEEENELGIAIHDVPDNHILLDLLKKILVKDKGTGQLIDAMDQICLYTAGCPDDGHTLETLLDDERIPDGAAVVVVSPEQTPDWNRCYWIFSGHSADGVYLKLKGLENTVVVDDRDHERIEESIPGEVPTAVELEEWFKRSGLKRFCKRAV